MSRDELVELIRRRDPLAAAAGLQPSGEITYRRGADPGVVADGERERPPEQHRADHAAGRATEATLRYGEGVDPARVAERLLALAAVAADTGMLRAVCPVPADGVRTPGSWGVEDLTVVAAARRVLNPHVRVRPSWSRLGAQACGVALAFGADDLEIPDDDPVDVTALAAAAGRLAVER